MRGVFTMTRTSDFGGKYDKFKGDIWVSKYDPTEKFQGINVTILKDNDLKAIGYIAKEDDKFYFEDAKFDDLETAIYEMMKSYGWNVDCCDRYLGRV